MKTKLKLREVSAYFSPCKVVIYDNEDLEVELVDRGRIKNKAVLTVNGAAFVFEDKRLTVPRGVLADVNVCELHEQTEEGKTVKRYTVETLYRLPHVAGYEDDRLLTERAFYQTAIKAFAIELSALKDELKQLKEQMGLTDAKVGSLEKGKFTILKFKEEEK